MNKKLLKVAIRNGALVLSKDWITQEISSEISETTSYLVVNCAKLGFGFSEELLHAVNGILAPNKLEILKILKEVTGVNKNWTPLIKEWNKPTGESIFDHIVTYFATLLKSQSGTKLACGHIIQDGTFPLERYNGCPYCGTPFEFSELEYEGGLNKLKILELWTEKDLKENLKDLIESPVALDASQIESLNALVSHYGLPKNINTKIKETLMILITVLEDQEMYEEAGTLFKTPADIMRYLWYKHTGFLQIIQPKVIRKRLARNANNIHSTMDKGKEVRLKSIADLKLKYTRIEAKRYATWLNKLDMDIEKQCEIMHPKRGMWIRFIRALRLVEYSKKKGFENLATLLDTFHNEKYTVWQGRVNHFKLKGNEKETFLLLKQRPGLFARALFSSMLWFGTETTLDHFKEIMDKVPARLIYTLNMYAEIYFDKNAIRSVKPLGGINKRIATNKLLDLYTDTELEKMKSKIQEMTLESAKNRFRKTKTTSKTIYIAEELKLIPVAIGDRSENIQDLPVALMGTRFPVEGSKIRLFLEWGEGLKAQHLDMDLSCHVSYSSGSEFCSYSQLTIPGCIHSGDIQRIPDMVGTAEYIDIDIDRLIKRKAKYVTFTCNAYTNGSLSPNLVVGWMNSKYPMNISKNGVAYDPTAVQHQVRIKQNMTKGLVFGVLDIDKREIVWLEMSFDGQIIQKLDNKGTEALLSKLDSKLKLVEILRIKAEAQSLKIVTDPELADEVYDIKWATNQAKVSKLLMGE